MARVGSFGQEDVNAVADQLVAEGVEPTILKVRERIGGGSATTINKYLKVWREGRPAKKTAPVEIPSELSVLLTRIIEQARSAGRAEIEGDHARMQGEFETISEAAEKMEAEIAELTEKNTALAAERDQKEGRIAELEKAKREQVERLESEKARIEADLAAERAEKERLRTELSVALLKSERLEGDTRDLIEGRKALEEKVNALREQLSSEEKNLAVALEKLRAIEELKAEREAELDRLRGALERQREQHQKEKESIDAAHAREVARLVADHESIRKEYQEREKRQDEKIKHLEAQKDQKQKEAQGEMRADPFAAATTRQ
jgi:chromosome segregation ATPase